VNYCHSTKDPAIQKRVKELVKDANLLLDAIRGLSASSSDPLIDPATLTVAVTSGLMDAPQLRNNKFGRGKVLTRIVDGASVAVDKKGKPISEKKRIEKIIK
jgi:hypothetical protein